MVLYTEFDKFVNESHSERSLYEIIVKNKDGKTSNHLVWAPDAVEAVEIYKRDHSDDKGIDSIHAEDLSYEDIERIKEKSSKKIEEMEKKMRKLAIEYSEMSKEKKKEKAMIDLLDGKTQEETERPEDSLAS